MKARGRGGLNESGERIPDLWSCRRPASTKWVKNAPGIRFFDATCPAKVGVVVV